MTRFYRLLTLFIMSCLILSPCHGIASTATSKGESELCLFDKMMLLIEEVEHGKLDHYSEEQIEQISKLLAVWAQNGLSSSDHEAKDQLDQDIIALFSNQPFLFDQAYGFELTPPIDQEDEIIFCGWISKKYKKTKKFVKKHKTIIIIGGTAVAATAAGLLIYSSCKKSDSTPSLPENDFSSAGLGLAVGAAALSGIAAESQEIPDLRPVKSIEEVIQETITPLKEALIEKVAAHQHKATIQEIARDVGSVMAHELLDAVAELTSFIPHTLEELNSISARIAPYLPFLKPLEEIPSNSRRFSDASPIENYRNLVSMGHQKIDEIFSTNAASLYTNEIKELLSKGRIEGFIPYPGMIANRPIAKLREAGLVIDREGYTKVGRSLTKHGNRDGSPFPKAKGSVSEINAQGQKILEEILMDPKKIIIENAEAGLEIYASDGRGAYFRSDGTFRGFIKYGHK